MCRATVTGGKLAQAEIDAYIAYAREKYGRPPDEIHIELDGEYANLDVHFYSPFDRIRRITGYLVGTVDRFNDGKRAEEHDRVKHTI